MSCLGVLFSLDKATVDKLKSFNNDEDRVDYMQVEIEEEMMNGEPGRFVELEKAWDALHRSLTDGRLTECNSVFPLSHVVLGGEKIHSEDDFIMVLKTPEQVVAIANAVAHVTEAQLRAGYNKISAKDYGQPLTKEDFDYTWGWFQQSLEFWQKAAEEKRYVLFTADQ